MPMLLDTGVLVALLDRRDAHHGQLSRLSAPLTLCEGVLAEACYHLGSVGLSTWGPLAFVERGAVRIEPLSADDVMQVRYLMERYRNVPMDFVDACLVVLADRLLDATILTVDSDFFVYRSRLGTVPTVVHPATHAI